jgi:hypothetical protein
VHFTASSCSRQRHELRQAPIAQSITISQNAARIRALASRNFLSIDLALSRQVTPPSDTVIYTSGRAFQLDRAVPKSLFFAKPYEPDAIVAIFVIEWGQNGEPAAP